MDLGRSATPWTELLGIVGFSGLVAALLIAHWNPATGYELSVYAATPTWFWVCIAVALLAALVVSFSADDDWYRLVGLLLGGLASLAIVSLPIIRGYYYEGLHDPLTHLGWTRAMLEGAMLPHELVYPALHTLGTFVSGVTGLSVWQSMMLVPRIVILVYFVFVPLVVFELVGGKAGTVVGAFSAFLLIPTHLIANHVHAHPSSQTILFAPLAIYLLVRYLRSTGPTRRTGVLTPFGALLSVVAIAAILYHPQQALNLVTMLGTVAVVQFVARKRGSTFLRSDLRPVYSIAAVAVVAFIAWTSRFSWIPALVERTANSVAYVGGASPEPGSAIGSQTFALQAIGASLPVVFLKLFFVSSVYVAITGVVLLVAFGSRRSGGRTWADTTDLLRLLGVGLVALFPAFVLYLLGDVSVYYFRQAGFMMMIGTIVGAVGIAYWLSAASTPPARVAVRSTAVAGFAAMLVLSALVLFPSPYVHNPNQHVTEARVSGYETTFQVTGESAYISGVRQEPERYHDALRSPIETGRLDGQVNSTEIHDLRRLRGGTWYLMMNRATYERELDAYHGYRYSRSDLESVRRQTNVDLVHANGDTELYFVTGS